MAKYFFNKEFLLTVNLLQSFKINVCLLAIVLETSKSKIGKKIGIDVCVGSEEIACNVLFRLVLCI